MKNKQANNPPVLMKKRRLTWRDTWYSVVIWLIGVAVGGFVILPWYYFALPFFVLWTTVIYFKKSDKTLAVGLWCALLWFFAVGLLDVLEIIGPYYSNAELYFSDSRNIIKYPIILLIPFIYSLMLEGRNGKKRLPKKAEFTDIELIKQGTIQV